MKTFRKWYDNFINQSLEQIFNKLHLHSDFLLFEERIPLILRIPKPWPQLLSVCLFHLHERWLWPLGFPTEKIPNDNLLSMAAEWLLLWNLTFSRVLPTTAMVEWMIRDFYLTRSDFTKKLGSIKISSFSQKQVKTHLLCW